jgi:hypothetical protein
MLPCEPPLSSSESLEARQGTFHEEDLLELFSTSVLSTRSRSGIGPSRLLYRDVIATDVESKADFSWLLRSIPMPVLEEYGSPNWWIAGTASTVRRYKMQQCNFFPNMGRTPMRTQHLGLLSGFVMAVWFIQAPQDATAGSLRKFLSDSGKAISKGAEDVSNLAKRGAKDVGNGLKEGADGGARAIRKAGSSVDNAIRKAEEDTCSSERQALRCPR